jgi:hypothetical protein
VRSTRYCLCVTRALMLLPVLAAAFLAACGGGGTSDEAAGNDDPVATYLERVRAADAVVQGKREILGESGPPGDLGDVAALEDELEEALRGLEEVPPPFELLPQNLPLTQALGEAMVIVSMLPTDGSATEADVMPLRAALQEAESAIAEMEANGYDVRADR